MTAPEEEIESLEEKFKRLRREGIEDEEIIRKVFEENPDADVGEICQITSLDPLTAGRIKEQAVRWTRQPETEIPEPTKEAEARMEGVPPLTPLKEGLGEQREGFSKREYIAQYGEEGLEGTKKRMPLEPLDSALGVGKATVKWITKQWQLDSNIKRVLNQLLNLLTTSGVKNDRL